MHPTKLTEFFMRICRFNDDRLGLVVDDGASVLDVTAALDAVPAQRWPLLPGDPLIANLAAVRRRIEAVAANAVKYPVAQVSLKAPVANPSKVIAAPNNYMKHFEEAKADRGINFGSEVKTIEHLGLFLKSSTSLVGPAEGVKLPSLDRRMDHEVEVAMIIGTAGYRIARADAMSHVAGYAVGLDMTVRGIEDRSFRKSFDSFSVVGPWLVTADEIAEPGNLDFSITVNGAPRQASNTRALIFDLPRLIEYASAAYALYPGDIILTGTPEGVGPVEPGDTMHCVVAGIGAMDVKIYAVAGS
jgi:2,4-didehydro-3-deoxy-L-rhamnonate hydrolase